MQLARTKGKARQTGLASVEAALVFAFLYLVFIVIIFQSVKLSYVSMDGLIAARNAAWKHETYFASDDSGNSFVNVGAITGQAVFGSSPPFVDGNVRNVHDMNVIAFSASEKGDMQKSVLKDVRAGLDANKGNADKDTDTAKGKVNLNAMTKILEDFDFKGVKGTSLATEVKLLGTNSEDDAPGIPGLAILKGGLVEAIAAIAGLKKRTHYTDFQVGWNLPTDEERQKRLQAEYPGPLVYHKGYDKQLTKIVGKKTLFSKSIPGA